MNLITLDQFNNPSIDPQVRLVPEFAKILKQKEKDMALKEICYVHFMADYRSLYNTYHQSIRSEMVIKDFLPKGWKIRPEITEAIEKYKSLNDSPSIKALKVAKESMMSSIAVMDKLREKIDELMEEEDREDGSSPLGAAVNLLKELNTLSSAIPKNIESLEKAEDRVKKEIGNNTKVRGGGDINPFEV